MEELRNAHKAQDLTAVDASMSKLNGIWQSASEEMYKNTQAEGGAQEAAGQAQGGPDDQKGGGDDEVTDVDLKKLMTKIGNIFTSLYIFLKPVASSSRFYFFLFF